MGVTRWCVGGGKLPFKDDNGIWVHHSDHAVTEAKVAALESKLARVVEAAGYFASIDDGDIPAFWEYAGNFKALRQAVDAAKVTP